MLSGFSLFHPSFLGRRVGAVSNMSAVQVLAGERERRKERVVFSIVQELWEERGGVIRGMLDVTGMGH